MKKILITTLLVSITCVAYLQASKQTPVEAGKKVYLKNCLACHLSDGGGVPGLNPPLTGDWVTGDKNRLIKVVLQGLYDSIQVNGETYINTMDSLPELSDQEVSDVLTYVRSSFGNKATPVLPAEVKAVRGK